MSWTVSLGDVEESTVEKIMTATWVDVTFGNFVYSAPYKSTAAIIADFVSKAISKRNTWLNKAQNRAAKETELLTALTTADV